jgi:1,4-dihydroxy-2-naphthoyl-CoA hydrolase
VAGTNTQGAKTTLRPDIDIDGFHARQVGTLPDRYGVRVTALAEGRMAMQFEIAPWMMAPNGFLHAASVIVLADTCAGYATIAHLPEGAKGFTTVELKSNFLGTAKSGVLRTEALAEHLGRTTQVWSAAVFNAQDRKIALFRCTQMILW